MSKIALLVAAGAGYVFGARAGRERYDALEAKAKELWRDPRVQEKAGQAQQAAKDAGSAVQEKASDLGSGKKASGEGGTHAASTSGTSSTPGTTGGGTAG